MYVRVMIKELRRIIAESHQQIGVANEGYVQYIIEKLETGLRSVNSIQEILVNGEHELEGEEREIAANYSRRITELATCIQTMLSYWHLYQDRLDSVNTDVHTGPSISLVNCVNVFQLQNN